MQCETYSGEPEADGAADHRISDSAKARVNQWNWGRVRPRLIQVVSLEVDDIRQAVALHCMGFN